MWLRTSLYTGLRQAARPVARQVRASMRPVPFLGTLQARLLSDTTRQVLEQAVGSAPVVLFMKGTPETPQCGFSRATVQILGLQGVDPAKVRAYNVLEDEEWRSGIKEFSDWPTIPQLYIDKEFVGGCDILLSMHQDGSLAKMLEEKGLLAPLEGSEEPKE